MLLTKLTTSQQVSLALIGLVKIKDITYRKGKTYIILNQAIKENSNDDLYIQWKNGFLVLLNTQNDLLRDCKRKPTTDTQVLSLDSIIG